MTPPPTWPPVGAQLPLTAPASLPLTDVDSRPLASTLRAQHHPRLRLPASTDPPSDKHPPTPKVWLVFGATGHIGRSLVKAALSHGDQVTAVGRAREDSLAAMQRWHERCHGLLCDVRVRETVHEAIQSSIRRWGRVDIIVNCTGYGVIGACEDQDDHDLRSQFETNFLGTLNIIQLSLPYFREEASKRKEGENAGRYLIFSSTSGALGIPGLGPYCATKYATEGLIESMLYEIDTFGIKATLVQPGHMRLDEPTGLADDHATDNGPDSNNGSSTNPPDAQTAKLKKYGHFLVKAPSAPYDTPTAPAGHARRVVQWLSDKQPTSAVKAAELVWQLGHCRFPPLRLLLGSFAMDSVRDRLRSIIEEIEDWKHLNFPLNPDDASGGAAKAPGDDGEIDDHGDANEFDAMDIDEHGHDNDNDHDAFLDAKDADDEG